VSIAVDWDSKDKGPTTVEAVRIVANRTIRLDLHLQASVSLDVRSRLRS